MAPPSVATPRAAIARRPAPALAGAARAIIPGRLRSALAGVARPLAHRGSEVACACCGGRFGSFAPHRARPHAKCPRCGSLERHRLLWLYIVGRTDVLSTRLRVLHFAPERGLRRLLAAAPNLSYRSADLDSPLADDHVDITELPYDDGAFDVVLCSHVLEHVSDDGRAMRELARVLSARGRAIVMCPIDGGRETTLELPGAITPAQRLSAYGQEDHARLYGRDFAQRLAAAGFEVSVEPLVDELEPELVRRFGLRREDVRFDRDDVYLCVKK